MNISIIGSGYVGLVTGTCLAHLGHRVTCIDKNKSIVSKINNGISPIFENGLEILLKQQVGKRLFASDDIVAAVHQTEASFIAVGTPFVEGTIDLSYISDSAHSIAQALRTKSDFHTVILKSTAVPKTTENFLIPLLEEISQKRCDVDFGVVSNPEFLREGLAVKDFLEPDRIVIGTRDKKSRSILEEIYSPFEGSRLFFTNPATAELTKYASNSLLACLISFANEIANIGTAFGDIDSHEVMEALFLDRRISIEKTDGVKLRPEITSYLRAGCGFGGSCLPKDVNALISSSTEHGYKPRLLTEVIKLNDQQPKQVIKLIQKHFPNLSAVKATILGLSFKPDTDDTRDSPSLRIINELTRRQCAVKFYDPHANPPPSLTSNSLATKSETIEESLKDTDVIIIATAWDCFKKLPEIIRSSSHLVVDARGMFAPSDFTLYEGIGR